MCAMPPPTIADVHTCSKTKCGCEDAGQSDYRGTISTTEDGKECERWDAEWMTFDEDTIELAGLDENYCRNPFGNVLRAGCYTSDFGEDGLRKFSHCVIPTCHPCSCMPGCGQPNLLKCGCPSVLQAEECCKEDEGQEKYSQCRCGYLKEACRLSLENNSTDFCENAEVECCTVEDDPHCKCVMYEQMCYEFPSSTCEFAAASCCEPLNKLNVFPETCYCDFYRFTKNDLDYESEHMLGNCSKAVEVDGDPVQLEKLWLVQIYNFTGGKDWHNNTGWSNETNSHCQSLGITCNENETNSHCQSFGITCNEDGLVTEIELRNNNLTGLGYKVFVSLVGAFKELKVLDLAENELTGDLRSGYIPTLSKLERIDLSNNAFTGHIDMTFPSSTSYVNFSHNRFTGISFKRFNAAYETLEVVDLSNNNISRDASKIFYNIPLNIDQLFLSSNAIKGNLPDPFPLEHLIRFAMADNEVNGNLPDFPTSTPLLRELDLSNQKRANGGGLIGTIWTDIFKLVDLLVLNLAGNSLSREIPTTIGNLAKLKVLNLSSDALSKQIPLELGRLKGRCIVRIHFYV
jgi:hypothetical protein